MPVIKKPHNEPLLGSRSVILFGGVDKAAMKRWQQRIRASKEEVPEADESSSKKSD